MPVREDMVTAVAGTDGGIVAVDARVEAEGVSAAVVEGADDEVMFVDVREAILAASSEAW